MNNDVVDLLNNMGAGTFILILIALITFVTFVINKITTISEKHRCKVAKEIEEKNSLDTLKNSVEELVTTVNELHTKIEKIDNDVTSFKEETSELINDIKENNNINEEKLKETEETINIIKDSQMSAIRSFIISEYHKWMKEGYIDIYSLSVIEERYENYQKQHGNTFIKDLVSQLRTLQYRSCITDENGNDPIKYFDEHPEKHPKYKQKLLESINKINE